MRVVNGTPVDLNAPTAVFAGMLGVAAMAVWRLIASHGQGRRPGVPLVLDAEECVWVEFANVSIACDGCCAAI